MSIQLSKPLTLGGSFTEPDSYINRELVNPEIYPHLYDDKKFKPLKLIPPRRSVLISVSSITLPPLGAGGANTPWVGDVNPHADEIAKSLKNGGMKLKYPPLAVYIDKHGNFRLLDGRTRWMTLVDKFKFTNVIVDIYQPNYDKYSDFEIADAIDKFQRAANFQGRDPAGKLKMEDLFQGMILAINMGWIPKDEAGQPMQDVLENRLEEIMGQENVYTADKFETLIYRIRNSVEESPSTRYWKNKETVKDFCNTILHNPLKDKKPVKNKDGTIIEKGIKYYYFETGSYARAILEAAEVAMDYPDSEIRIVIYSKALKGYNLSENFWVRIDAFKGKWDVGFAKLAQVYWRGRGPYHERVKLYAAVPSLAKDHDLFKLLFLQSDGTWKQKT